MSAEQGENAKTNSWREKVLAAEASRAVISGGNTVLTPHAWLALVPASATTDYQVSECGVGSRWETVQQMQHLRCTGSHWMKSLLLLLLLATTTLYRAPRYSDEFVMMYVYICVYVCDGCGCVLCWHTKRKTSDRNDLKLGMIVVILDSLSKAVDFGFKRSRVRGKGLTFHNFGNNCHLADKIKMITIFYNKKLSWCWQTRATHLEVSQGHQT